ncbi:hypothetical protein HY797_00720 [Candidatus Falkowbacteria bacterium]|nr:hypothetical protein [Candidatus Falkowbacteria bacterium]
MRRRSFLFIMPIFILAWFFVLGIEARAANGPDHLWHFDECEGNIAKDSAGAENLPQNAVWIPGKWQCAISQSWQTQYDIEKAFSTSLPAGELTLSLYWRNSAFPNEGRNHIYLKKADGSVAAGIRPTMIYNPSIYNSTLFYDGGATSFVPAIPSDSNWHLITITYSQTGIGYYIDGAPKAFLNGNYAIKSLINSIEMKGENWPVNMDELAVWSRALSAEEVANIYNADQPLEPYNPPSVPEKARLINLWHFDEGSGAIAADSVGATVISPIVKWSEGKFGKGIEHTWRDGYLISQNLSQPIDSKDLSIDFWWQNSAYPNEGRVSLELQNSAGVKIFGIRPSIYSGQYYFDGSDIAIGDIIPQDNAWHHLALVYDSYNFYLAFYVDGVEKIKVPKVWFRRPITKLVIRGENWWYNIDELAIWQGALSRTEIKDHYDSGQPHSAAAEPDPVILVPGIMGSWNVSGRWQLDPIFHTYDNLMEALIAAGYKENSLSEDKPTLFTFPYDWRVDNNITANLLKEKIQQVKEMTGKDKIDIIAHSMGGLVTRSYAEGDDYRNDIDQVIFLGTPHQGSPESYLKYEGAAGFFTTSEKLTKYLFQIEAVLNGYFDLTDYIRAKVLTVEQLLPIYDYLKEKQPDNSWQLRPYPLNYPQNNYLENLNSQAKIDLLKQRVKITNIIGDLGENSTLNYLKVIADPDLSDNKWQSGYPENLDQNINSLEMGNGDSTVPLFSADSLSGVEIFKTGISDHTNFPTVMQKEIIKVLTDKEPTNYFNSKITATFKRWAFFRVYSPVDFAVIAPNGQRVGKDFINNAEINEIPDAFYSGFNDHEEFVLIPNPADGEYKIELRGVANGGEYALVSSLINGNTEISREFSGNITPDQQRDFNITYSAEPENPLSDLEPIDNASPVIAINRPIESEKYLRSDDLAIDYTADDDFSGIDTIIITIDGQEVSTTTIDLFDYALGQHSLIIQAIDKAGNQAQAQVNFEIIANIDSTISDIEEINERGWFKGKLYKPILINAFKLLDIEARYFNKEQDLIEKLIKKTQDDERLTDKQKQKLIEQYNKKLNNLKENRLKAINRSLDIIETALFFPSHFFYHYLF